MVPWAKVQGVMFVILCIIKHHPSIFLEYETHGLFLEWKDFDYLWDVSQFSFRRLVAMLEKFGFYLAEMTWLFL